MESAETSDANTKALDQMQTADIKDIPALPANIVAHQIQEQKDFFLKEWVDFKTEIMILLDKNKDGIPDFLEKIATEKRKQQWDYFRKYWLPVLTYMVGTAQTFVYIWITLKSA